jgi:WD40 repeat protein
VALRRDGGTLASGSQDGTVKLWDGAKTLATAGADDDVKLWDPVSGRQTTTLRGQTGWIRALAFSPDGYTPNGSSPWPTAPTASRWPWDRALGLFSSGTWGTLNDRQQRALGRVGNRSEQSVRLRPRHPGPATVSERVAPPSANDDRHRLGYRCQFLVGDAV